MIQNELFSSTLYLLRRYEKLVSGMLLLTFFILGLSLLQFSTPNLVGNDGYYHIKMADFMSTGNLKPYFPWLSLTILNPGEFSNHHFLFHVLLIPFTLGDLVLGAKMATVLFASFAFFCVWCLLRGQDIPFAGLWALGLFAVSEAFLYRMSMPRTQSLSLAVLVLGMHFVLQKKYWYLLPLSFVYVWLYDAFPLMLILVAVYLFTQGLIMRKIEIQPLLYVLAGVTFGLLINPYFPDNIIFSARHVIPKLFGEAEVRVGNEWYPYDTAQLLENSPMILIAFLSGIFALGMNSRRMDLRTAFALFLSILFGLMLFQSRRFIEYFPAFGLVFTAFAWTPLILDVRTAPGEASTQVKHEEPHKFLSWKKVAGRTQVVAALLLATLIAGSAYAMWNARSQLQDAKPADLYASASDWLIANTPQGTRIFQTDWDDFPRLFFHNTWNTYIVGLDPTYLQIKDPDLFDQWVSITRGEVEDPGQQILLDFAAEFVLSDLAHQDFIDQAGADQGLIEVYKDNQAIIYRVQLPEG